MKENPPYGRGFIAAAIVIGAILLCAALLIFTAPPRTTNRSATDLEAGVQPALGNNAPTTPARADQPPATPAPGNPASGHPATPADPANSCAPLNSTSGDSVPTVAPVVEGWEVSRRVVVPRSSAYGPGKQDPDGFRRCFAHSPTGAVFAAYSAVAAMADQRQVLTTVAKLMLPGPNTDALLADLRKEPADEDANPTQVAGFRVLDSTQDRATVVLAMPVETAYVSANFTLVWHNRDWRVVPPNPGDALGSPYAQQRDLSGFVPWSGV